MHPTSATDKNDSRIATKRNKSTGLKLRKIQSQVLTPNQNGVNSHQDFESLKALGGSQVNPHFPHSSTSSNLIPLTFKPQGLRENDKVLS